MRHTCLAILLFTCLLASACSAPAPLWRQRAQVQLGELERLGAEKLFPRELQSARDTFRQGEKVLKDQEDEEKADSFYQLTIQKTSLLKSDVQRHRQLQLEERQRAAAERARRVREEQLIREAAEAEERLRQQGQNQSGEESKAASRSVRQRDTVSAKPTAYTVKRGETLPQIAARSEIYNNASLWPLIYRANRDQIRDPKRLWPGQVLTIPRNFSRGEANEARRFSGMK